MRVEPRGVSWWVLGLLSCATAGPVDYRASAAVAEQDWGDRLHVERGGVRLVAGPVSVFPYEWRVDGELARGQYQLFTRVVVHNTGDRPAEVLWSEARLLLPSGGSVRLIDTVRAVGAPERSGAAALVDRLEPGQRVTRALLPATVWELEAGEPMVPLCDGCEYRLVVPVRIGSREERLELSFRLGLDRSTSGGGTSGPYEE